MADTVEPDTKYTYFPRIHYCKGLIGNEHIEIRSGRFPGELADKSIVVEPGERWVEQIKFCPYCGVEPLPFRFDKETGKYIPIRRCNSCGATISDEEKHEIFEKYPVWAKFALFPCMKCNKENFTK